MQKFKSDPDKNFLVIFVVAGHGMNDSGHQVLLINEFDDNTKFYKKFQLEKKLRTFAKMYPNTYNMAFCACCREIFNEERHFGFKTKEEAEAKKEFKTKREAYEIKAKPEESRDDEEEAKARGVGELVEQKDRQNVVLFFGCMPGLVVDAQTKMIKDVVEILKKRYSKTDFFVQFPDCFSDIIGQDVNFEMVASNTLQPVNFLYCHNIVTHSIAAIFVSTKLDNGY